ncbi:MAG: hypothetical protein AB1668_07540 [Nanoarchaeota archaeon]
MKEDEEKKDMEEVVEEVEEENSISKNIEIKRCKRCGFKHVVGKEVIREQQKCCPECLAPISWAS